MKFGHRLSIEATPEWKSKYINYNGLKRYLKTIPPQSRSAIGEQSILSQVDSKPEPNLLPLSAQERLFFERLDEEIVKVEEFYLEKEREAVRTKNLLSKQLAALKGPPKTRPESNLFELFGIRKDGDLGAEPMHLASRTKNPVSEPDLDHHDETQLTFSSILTSLKQSALKRQFKTQLHHLKKDILEYYRSLILLQNYQSLNCIGFTKILKKYDKITNRNYKEKYTKTIEEKHFSSEKTVDDLISWIENLYSIMFADGNRHQAMASLRLPERILDSHTDVSFCSGILGGLTCSMILYMALNFSRFNMGLLYIYAGLSLPIIYCWLSCINLVVWKRSGVNYQFIFGLNQRDYLSIPQFSLLVSSICFVFVVYVCLSLLGLMDSMLEDYWQPLVLILVLAGLFAMPIKIFFYSSRIWMLKVLLMIFAPFFYEVKFKSFFIADILTSLPFFFRIHKAVYLSATKGRIITSPPPPTMDVYILMSLPLFSRAIQCLRRYRDSKAMFPHLANFLKYSMSLVASLLSCLFNAYGIQHIFSLWILVGCASSLFSLYWDLVMDWGFLRYSKANPLLRNQLLYSPKFVYYLVILSNIFMRFSWMISILGVGPWGVFLLAVGEVFRRFLWSFFRLEYEHLNNCGECKAFYSISPPFEGDLFFQSDAGLDNNDRESELEE